MVHPKTKMQSSFSPSTCSKPVRVSFFCWTQEKTFWRKWVDGSHWLPLYKSKILWLPSVVWLPTFFQISSFVQQKKETCATLLRWMGILTDSFLQLVGWFLFRTEKPLFHHQRVFWVVRISKVFPKCTRWRFKRFLVCRSMLEAINSTDWESDLLTVLSWMLAWSHMRTSICSPHCMSL